MLVIIELRENSWRIIVEKKKETWGTKAVSALDFFFGRFYRDDGKIKNGQIWPLSALGLSTRENFTETVVEVTELAV